MMQDWICFTSFNRRLYDIIAQEMLLSWLHYWPKTARLVIYLEDGIDLPPDPRIEVRDWQALCGDAFQQVGERARDMVFYQSDQTQRYTKKGLTFIHMLSQGPGRVCWLDADLITTAAVPEDMLDRAYDAATVVSLFDGSRPQSDGLQPWTAESGFVMIDTAHERFPDFLARYRDYYDHPRMPEHAIMYWDGEILMHAARECGSWFDLRSQCRGKSSTPLHVHWLGQYMHHIKSKRKKHYSLQTYRQFWQDGLDLATAATRFPWQK